MAAIREVSEDRLLSQPERQWRAAICLGWPLAMIAAPVLLSLGNLPCPFRQLSGLPCPLCGGTHVCAALVQGDFHSAWLANPGVMLVLVLAAVHTSLLARESLVGLRLGTQRFWSRVWTGGGVIFLVAWGMRLLGFV
jgi:hypothetical protein